MSTATDERIELDVDLDKAPACNISDDDCKQPATWKLANLCPGRHFWLSCDGHKLAHEKQTRDIYASPVGVIAQLRGVHLLECSVCKTPLPTPPSEWSPL